jgi:hypothetical protein
MQLNNGYVLNIDFTYTRIKISDLQLIENCINFAP